MTQPDDLFDGGSIEPEPLPADFVDAVMQAMEAVALVIALGCIGAMVETAMRWAP